MSRTQKPEKTQQKQKRPTKHSFNIKYLVIPSSADFDVNDDIGGKRQQEIRGIARGASIPRTCDQFLFQGYRAEKIGKRAIKSDFENSAFVMSLLDQLGASFTFSKTKGDRQGGVDRITHPIISSKSQDRNSPPGYKVDLVGALTGDGYHTGFTFKDNKLDGSSTLSVAGRGPGLFQRRVDSILSRINGAKDTDKLKEILKSYQEDSVLGYLTRDSAEIVDNTKYTLSYQKYMLSQSLMILKAQAAEIVSTLSIKASYRAALDIYGRVDAEIEECYRICSEIEDSFKIQVVPTLSRVNQVELSQVTRLDDVNKPLSVAEKSPAMEPFESKILTDYQLSEILKRVISASVVTELESGLKQILGQGFKISNRVSAIDGNYYSSDLKALLNHLKDENPTQAEAIERLRNELGSKLDDHILSSDQASLMRQFEETLLDIKEQQFKAKAFATLATGAGKSFLAGIAKGYRETIIKSWEIQKRGAINRDDSRAFTAEELETIRFVNRVKTDSSYAKKLALQKDIAASGTDEKKPTKQQIEDGFKIDIINLANQGELDKVLEELDPNSVKPLKGRVFFVDERLYHKGEKTYTKVGEISRLGGKVILFGANENKALLHQRVSRLRRKQANLENQLREMFTSISEEVSVVEGFENQFAEATPRRESVVNATSQQKANKSKSTPKIEALAEEISQENVIEEEISYEDKKKEVEEEYASLNAQIEGIKGLWKKVEDLGSQENKNSVKRVCEAHYLWFVLNSQGSGDGMKSYFAKNFSVIQEVEEKLQELKKNKNTGGRTDTAIRKDILSEIFRTEKSNFSDMSYSPLSVLTTDIKGINQALTTFGLKVPLSTFSLVKNNQYATVTNNIAILSATEVKEVIRGKYNLLSERRQDLAAKKRALDLYFARKTKIADAVDGLKKIDLREDNIARNKIGLGAEKSVLTISTGLKGRVEGKSISDIVPIKTESEAAKRTQHILPGLKILEGITIAANNTASGLSEEQTQLIANLKTAILNRNGYLLANFVTQDKQHACVVIDERGEAKYYTDQDPNFLNLLDTISANGSEVTMLYAGDLEYVVGGDYGPLSKLMVSRGDKQYIYITREEDIDINNFEQFIGRNRSSDNVDIEIVIDQDLANRLNIKTKEDLINLLYLFHNYVNAKKRKPLFTTLLSYYTKSQIDTTLLSYYTKSQIDTNIYTKTQSDTNYYSKSATDTLLNAKANITYVDTQDALKLNLSGGTMTGSYTSQHYTLMQ